MLRVFTVFSGYDSQCMALDRTGIEYDLVGWSEIDGPVIQAHDAVYPQWKDRNFGDIRKIDWNSVPDFDLFTYSFPCTQISRMGNETGLSEGSGTESSLLWECRKAIRRKLPKYLLLENVSALLSKKFVGSFCKWQAELEELGYTNYTKVLNASDYGIPQNRKRVYMVSILHGNVPYYFPRPVPLERVLSDFLDSDVADRYYLKRSTVDGYIENTKKMRMRGNGFRFEMSDLNGIAKTLTTKSGSRMTDNYIDASKMSVSKSNGIISEDRYMRGGLCGLRQ